MSLFWENAAKIMDAAVSAVSSGFASSETMTVLIGLEGGIHILPDNDWPLERIAQERGARMAYRVSQNENCISVNGLNGVTRCRLETEKPGAVARHLLRDQPRYLLD
jgi:hypothetical protein